MCDSACQTGIASKSFLTRIRSPALALGPWPTLIRAGCVCRHNFSTLDRQKMFINAIRSIYSTHNRPRHLLSRRERSPDMLTFARHSLPTKCVRAYSGHAPRRARVYTRQAVCAAPAASGCIVGPVCKQMLGLLDDADCSMVQKLVVPSGWPNLSQLIRSTQEGLQEFARSAFNVDDVKVSLVGSAEAGTQLPDTSPAFFVQLPDYDSSKHESYVESMKQHFEDVHRNRHTTQELELLPSESGILFKPTGSTQSFMLLIGGSSSGQQPVTGPREVVSLASVVARTTYLQQQPYLFKFAARVAMRWAQSCMGAGCFRCVCIRQEWAMQWPIPCNGTADVVTEAPTTVAHCALEVLVS